MRVQNNVTDPAQLTSTLHVLYVFCSTTGRMFGMRNLADDYVEFAQQVYAHLEDRDWVMQALDAGEQLYTAAIPITEDTDLLAVAKDLEALSIAEVLLRADRVCVASADAWAVLGVASQDALIARLFTLEVATGAGRRAELASTPEPGRAEVLR